MGIAQPLKNIIQVAYGKDKLRTIIATDLPPKNFDYFVKLSDKRDSGTPPHWAIALQQELTKQFGVIGTWKKQEEDVLILKPTSTGMQGFIPSHTMPNGRAIEMGRGNVSFHEQPVSILISVLEQRFHIPVVDQTGLSKQYDFALKWEESDPKHLNLEGLKQALHDQLGLDVVPGREPIEMLVVEKVK